MGAISRFLRYHFTNITGTRKYHFDHLLPNHKNRDKLIISFGPFKMLSTEEKQLEAPADCK
jgi:hypothetical protein